MRRRSFLLLLLSVFLLSLFGGLIFRGKAQTPSLATVTLCARFCDNALAESLSCEEESATVDGAPCRILSLSVRASTVTREEGGVPVRFPSRLASDVFFEIETEVSVKDGLPYAADAFLSPGKRVLLSSSVFHGECEILAVKVLKNGQKTAKK